MQVLAGVDLVAISDFQLSLQRGGERLANRIFTPTELTNPEPAHLAGLFAAKEAIIKALSLKAGDWRKIEITSQKSGRPKATFPRKVESSDLSISHTGGFAVALFVAIV